MMPTRKFTTATTALTLTRVSACQSIASPVTSQVRKRPVRALTVADMVGSPFGLLDDDLADHRVVADAAEFVADDPEVAPLVGNDLEPVVVAGHDLEVQVDGVQAEAVVDVH